MGLERERFQNLEVLNAYRDLDLYSNSTKSLGALRSRGMAFHKELFSAVT